MLKISVIIPLYNAKDVIALTIKSVLEQTCTDYELIVVDDGSTDGSGDVVRSFGNKVRYEYFQNGGVAKARNRGISLAKGEYLAFLDHDDLWASSKLERQLAVLESSSEIGLVTTDVENIDWSGQRIGTSKGYNPAYPFWRLFVKGFVVLPSTALVRRRILDQVGGFDETFEAAGLDDLELWPRIAQVSEIYCIPEPLTFHRLHSPADPEIWLHHRQILIEKLQQRFGSKPKHRRYLLEEKVAYLCDLGEHKIRQGFVQEGRSVLWKAFSLGTRSFANPKMWARSIFRSLRSYTFCTYRLGSRP